ncbi:MAG: NeuD/PglB/VioB family sugar acetyltransferase [Planctomycetota bacterium]
MSRRIALIGGGGHAKVIIDAVRMMGRFATALDHVVAIVDDDSSKHGSEIMGIPVIGPTVMVSQADADSIFVAVGSAGDARPRRRLFDIATASGLALPTIAHPASIVSPDASIGDGTCLLAASVVQVAATVGANVIVNTGAIVEHDATIGDHSHVCPGAVVLGNARVGQACHIGAGSVVVQGVRVGDGAVVAAGAVVRADVEPNQVVGGVPARVMSVLS